MLIKIKEKIDINAPGNVAEIFQKILATENEKIVRPTKNLWFWARAIKAWPLTMNHTSRKQAAEVVIPLCLNPKKG